LRLLAPKLSTLKEFSYSAEDQRREAMSRASKMSIQGVQPKVSVRLNVHMGQFEIVDRGGRFIVKPQTEMYQELPENEDVTMRMAALCKIEVPFHGLIYCKDGSKSFFIKRFDRIGRKRKQATEDFAQLSGNSRDTKYDFSMERLAGIIDTFCTFPMLEKARLFRRTIFNFLCGNEDMHLKNFSVIRRENKIELAPAYDLLNTTIALSHPQEELALPLQGKKRGITRSILIDYFGRERLGLNSKIIDAVLSDIRESFDKWNELLACCFLTKEMRGKYGRLLEDRKTLLAL
jgi:serine/threonine-protein kinase HipA